jgi:hypothetical protein
MQRTCSDFDAGSGDTAGPDMAILLIEHGYEL